MPSSNRSDFSSRCACEPLRPTASDRVNPISDSHRSCPAAAEHLKDRSVTDRPTWGQSGAPAAANRGWRSSGAPRADWAVHVRGRCMLYPETPESAGPIGLACVVGQMVRVSGEIDMSNVAQLKVALDKAARRSPEGFLVDLTEVVYLDSAALGVFRQFARRSCAPVYRVVPGSICERALQIFGLQEAIAAPH